MFQHTAARRRLLLPPTFAPYCSAVSTHSPPKAAALNGEPVLLRSGSFNTQPRGDGCGRFTIFCSIVTGFNTQPRGGGCSLQYGPRLLINLFQHTAVSTHSRAKAAAGARTQSLLSENVSTHSRAEAAAHLIIFRYVVISSFNTQPRGGGCNVACFNFEQPALFQHTAARRRLHT